MFLYNTGGVAIDNINFVGAAGNTAHGINVYADLPSGTKLDGVVFNNADVSGFGGYGIVVGAWNGLTGYTNLRMTNVRSHGNSLGGIQVYGYQNSVGRANSSTSFTTYNTYGWGLAGDTPILTRP